MKAWTAGNIVLVVTSSGKKKKIFPAMVWDKATFPDDIPKLKGRAKGLPIRRFGKKKHYEWVNIKNARPFDAKSEPKSKKYEQEFDIAKRIEAGEGVEGYEAFRALKQKTKEELSTTQERESKAKSAKSKVIESAEDVKDAVKDPSLEPKILRVIEAYFKEKILANDKITKRTIKEHISMTLDLDPKDKAVRSILKRVLPGAIEKFLKAGNDAAKDAADSKGNAEKAKDEPDKENTKATFSSKGTKGGGEEQQDEEPKQEKETDGTKTVRMEEESANADKERDCVVMEQDSPAEVKSELKKKTKLPDKSARKLKKEEESAEVEKGTGTVEEEEVPAKDKEEFQKIKTESREEEGRDITENANRVKEEEQDSVKKSKEVARALNKKERAVKEEGEKEDREVAVKVKEPDTKTERQKAREAAELKEQEEWDKKATIFEEKIEKWKEDLSVGEEKIKKVKFKIRELEEKESELLDRIQKEKRRREVLNATRKGRRLKKHQQYIPQVQDTSVSRKRKKIPKKSAVVVRREHITKIKKARVALPPREVERKRDKPRNPRDSSHRMNDPRNSTNRPHLHGRTHDQRPPPIANPFMRGAVPIPCHPPHAVPPQLHPFTVPPYHYLPHAPNQMLPAIQGVQPVHGGHSGHGGYVTTQIHTPPDPIQKDPWGGFGPPPKRSRFGPRMDGGWRRNEDRDKDRDRKQPRFRERDRDSRNTGRGFRDRDRDFRDRDFRDRERDRNRDNDRSRGTERETRNRDDGRRDDRSRRDRRDYRQDEKDRRNGHDFVKAHNSSADDFKLKKTKRERSSQRKKFDLKEAIRRTLGKLPTNFGELLTGDRADLADGNETEEEKVDAEWEKYMVRKAKERESRLKAKERGERRS